jgi:S-adenosyl-L-methionine hydrolase (adenosine-forming)
VLPGPIITLTTDFGLRDPFVGIMKGVMLGICPGARMVDLTHCIAPHDVLEGALALESAWRFFPPGTVHLAVVDPGVGTSRRAIALRSSGHYFVGPDNGLFTFAFTGAWTAVSVESAEYRLPEVSRTFHGRDVFSPAAAHLAGGVALGRLGPEAADLIRIAMPRYRRDADGLEGIVIGCDRFGNLLTSVTLDGIEQLGAPDSLVVELAGRNLGPVLNSYAEAADGAPSPIVGSSGRIEIFVRNGSAQAVLGDAMGAPVRARTVPRRPV